MIHEEKCFCATCDNCGEIFEDGEYSLYPLESDVKEAMKNHEEWYCGDTDKEHLGKHYCFDCFKWHPEIDDKIILDTSRTKLTIEDYKEVFEDHKRLVRELDVLLNGENAAEQASLCDIVSQLKNKQS